MWSTEPQRPIHSLLSLLPLPSLPSLPSLPFLPSSPPLPPLHSTLAPHALLPTHIRLSSRHGRQVPPDRHRCSGGGCEVAGRWSEAGVGVVAGEEQHHGGVGLLDCPPPQTASPHCTVGEGGGGSEGVWQ
ncbi:unnamed protein product [Closterium sp. Naga37s-1]|nr:unnamed protein product [Closterium sp. Naga37s-1]